MSIYNSTLGISQNSLTSSWLTNNTIISKNYSYNYNLQSFIGSFEGYDGEDFLLSNDRIVINSNIISSINLDNFKNDSLEKTNDTNRNIYEQSNPTRSDFVTKKAITLNSINN